MALKEYIMATQTSGENAREVVGHAADRARDMASALADKAKETASTAVGKAKDVAGQVPQQVQGLVKDATKKADEATGYVGGSMRSAAETVRSKGPHEGVLGSATSATASAMENTGKYLEDEKLSGMAGDVAGLIRRNPIPALLLAAGVGFLIGRSLRS
jgi:ElaB/YqjD/DUF883 family membrane-anchored ribosome-binding protein